MTRRAARDTISTCSSCGFSSKRTTAGLAAHALNLHSCARRQRTDASHARGQARRAAVDRTPKPCLHKYANHQHATHACYTLDACRCPPCTAAETTYERKRIRAHAYGRFDALVPAEPVREHVRALMAAGMGLKRIAKVAGVSTGSVSKLIYGNYQPDGTRHVSTRVQKATAQRLLAVTSFEADLAAGACVDSIGTQRRLRALVANGWSQSKLATRLGIGIANFSAMLNRTQVQARTARAVRDLYDELWDTPPPQAEHRDKISVSRSRRYAADRGWEPPLAWDDDTIDLPITTQLEPDELTTGYDEIAVHRIMDGSLATPANITTPDLIEAVRRLHQRGETDGAIGRRVGRSTGAILKIRRRHLEVAA